METKPLIWENKCKDFPSLDRNIEVDVAVVGGGIAGILTAYMLKKAGKDPVVFEKDKIGQGITKGTTAFITSHHDTLYCERLAKLGFSKTKLFLEANNEAINEYIELSKKYDFDFEQLSHVLYTTSNEQLLKKEKEALDRLKVSYQQLDNNELPFKFVDAISIPNQAQMNPLKLIKELSNDLNIYENSKVTSISNNRLTINGHCVKANKIVVATHFPFIKRFGAFFMKMYQKRSYVIGIDNAPKLNAMYTGIEQSSFYFRSYKDYLLIGGNDTRTGSYNNPFQELKSFAEINYPKSKICFEWANQDCVTLDDLPYIGLYTLLNPNMYVITGFNLWGMSQAMIASKVITDMIVSKANKYQKLFNPHRIVINKVLWNNTKTYVKHLFTFKKKCSHLGSNLIWNETEKSWDCPCHGSRFNTDGKIIDGPATKELKNKN